MTVLNHKVLSLATSVLQRYDFYIHYQVACILYNKYSFVIGLDMIPYLLVMV
jgi:hypothetical protein